MVEESDLDWHLKPCPVCVGEKINEISIEKYGKTIEQLIKEGIKIPPDENAEMLREAEEFCQSQHHVDEERYMVLHENHLETAMYHIRNREGANIFPSPPYYYDYCIYHKKNKLGLSWNFYTIPTMIYWYLKIAKDVRYRDFQDAGVSRKVIDHCLKMAKKYVKKQ